MDDFSKLIIVTILIAALIAIKYWLDTKRIEANRQLADTILSHVAPNKHGRIVSINLKTLEIEWENDGVLTHIVPTPVTQPIDPRAPHAVRLIRGCLEVDPHGTQIIPANKISGMSTQTREDAVAYLIERGFVAKVDRGAIEITKATQSFGHILAQLPQVGPDVLAQAVAALPRVVHPDQSIDDNETVDNNGRQ